VAPISGSGPITNFYGKTSRLFTKNDTKVGITDYAEIPLVANKVVLAIRWSINTLAAGHKNGT
jgi:hypothetical protein